MITNATLTAWSHVTGSNSAGEPTFTAQTIPPVRVLMEACSKRLNVGERRLTASVQIRVWPGGPAVTAGDSITVNGQDLSVLAVGSTPGTLSHLLLYCA